MSKKVTLPSGATATLKDPNTLRVKDRRAIMTASEKAEGGDLAKALALSDALLAILITDWSFDFPIPSVKTSSVDELEMKDYDALVEHTKEAQKALFPSLAETVENENDPKAITGNSNA